MIRIVVMKRLLVVKRDPEDKIFDKEPMELKITLPQHLARKAKAEEGEVPDYSAQAGAGSGSGFVPPRQRPTPTFISNTKQEPADATIPWESPAGRRERRKDGFTMASHHCHHQVTKVAHHPSPNSLPCHRPSPCLTSSSQPTSRTTQVTVWCHTGDEMACLPPPDSTGHRIGGMGAASPARSNTRHSDNIQDDRVTTRAGIKKRYRD